MPPDVYKRQIVDREKEIEAFKPEEYWNIDAVLCPPGQAKKFTARLAEREGKKLEVKTKAEADAILADVKGEAFTAVSYTHLDVYKRQPLWRAMPGSFAFIRARWKNASAFR